MEEPLVFLSALRPAVLSTLAQNPGLTLQELQALVSAAVATLHKTFGASVSVSEAKRRKLPQPAQTAQQLQQVHGQATQCVAQARPRAPPHIPAQVQPTVAPVTLSFNGTAASDGNPTPVRVYIDGCWDIMHSGHYNAIRQAKALGDVLVVGVHSNKEILCHKGPPVMTDDERMCMVTNCKWVDEVAFDTPYQPTLQLLDRLKCDFCVHGDDMPTAEDGSPAYGPVSQAGRLRIIKRTEGVSTTDIVGRLLLMTRSHLGDGQIENMVPSSTASGGGIGTSGLVPTSRRLSQFANSRAPKAGDRVVYIDGAWDMLHQGHIEALQAAKREGHFLYVGVHTDATVNVHRGRNYPIMPLHERALNLMACKHVDEVVIGAPWIVSRDLMASLNISLVLGAECESSGNRFQQCKELAIFKSFPGVAKLDTKDIVDRVIANRLRYEKRNTVCLPKLQAYREQKKFVPEI